MHINKISPSYKALRFIILVLVVGVFLSCSGQKGTAIAQNVTGEIVEEIDERIWEIFQDTKGNYWFGSNGRGVYHYDGSTLKRFTTNHGLVDNTIRGMQEDVHGHVFIETPKGISKYDGNTFETLKVIRSSANAWKLEPNDLWFGYNAYDLYRYDGESLMELQLPRQDLEKAFGIETSGVSFQDINNSPYAVFGVNKDKAGNVWFGTATAGAFRYDGDSFLWFGEKELSQLPDGRVPGVRSMVQDADGNFWLSNFLSKYKIDSNLPKGYEKMPAVYIATEVLEEKLPYFMSGVLGVEGNLWMTTYGGGVWKYDGDTLSNIEIKNEEGEVLLITIFEDRDGVKWLGTDNDGVYKQNGDQFEKFEIKK